MGYKNSKEFMKIRAELFCQMSKLNSPRKTLPSLRKLAEEFSVSHPTVMRAVHSLIEDGFLAVGKNGGYRSLLESEHCKIRIYGLVNGVGNYSFEFRTQWELNIPLVRNLFSRDSRICTKNIFLDKPENLHTAIYENGLSGILLSAPGKSIVTAARKVKDKIDIPIVSFYSPFRSISSSFPEKEAFYCLFQRMTEEKRENILVILSKDHLFHLEILESVKYAELMLHIKMTILFGSGSEMIRALEKIYGEGKHFDGVIFFSTMESVYQLICSHEDTDEKCRLMIDQFELKREMNYTGYLYRFDLESAAGKLIDNLMEQSVDCEKKVFIPMDVSIETYRNGIRQDREGKQNLDRRNDL